MEVYDIAKEFVMLATEENISVSTCESMTGGLIAGTITSIPGASNIYYGGFVTYTVESKCQFLNLDINFFDTTSVVSEKTAFIMAQRICEITGSDLGISVTGFAGPDDGPENGHVCVGLCWRKNTTTFTKQFYGTRDEVREKTVQFSLLQGIEILRRNRNE
ncbi:MAG: CinA family protein [Tissierellia bacterium]|nr:CinA family protein [Tissierellia bacterium]